MRQINAINPLKHVPLKFVFHSYEFVQVTEVSLSLDTCLPMLTVDETDSEKKTIILCITGNKAQSSGQQI